MGGALENLNLEEGKSGALRAVFACLAEATAADGGPRYGGKVCRDLARAVVCRSYGNAILELTHLIAAVSAGGGRIEHIVWGVPRASAGAFRAQMQDLTPTPALRIGAGAIAHIDGTRHFRIAYGRMPFLAALLEFLVSTIGYQALDDALRPLRFGADHDAVSTVAGDLQRRVYAYLKDHLPPAQRQRRERHFLAFAADNAGNKPASESINDDIVLGYWQTFAAGGPVEAKTYRSVYDTARRLIVALDSAGARLAAGYAASIGTDVEAGEVDPADIDAVCAALDDGVPPLQRLMESCGDRVKFLTASDAERLQEIPNEPGVGRRLAVSALRNAVHGARQVRLSNALRRGGDGLAELLAPPAGPYYGARIDDYRSKLAGLERMAMAALWLLHQAGREESIDLALALAPDLNWGVLADRPDPADDDVDDAAVVSLAERDAARRFLAEQPDPRGDEVQALLAEAGKTFRGVNRAGFKAAPDDAVLAILAGAVPDVLALMATLRRFVAVDLQRHDWRSLETADAVCFGAMFKTLYGAGEGADAG